MAMRRNIVLFVLLIVAISYIPVPCHAQGTFPRDGNEALALRVFNGYKESLARQVAWENGRKELREMIKEVAPAGHEVAHAIPMEDIAMLARVDQEIEGEKAWRQKLVEFWDKNRATAGAAERSFKWRYGALSEGASQKDLELIASNIRNFPFNETTPPKMHGGVDEHGTTTNGGVSDLSGTWGGRWNLASQYVVGPLDVKQSGSSVSGKYANGGSAFGQIQGTVTGDTLVGTWTDPVSKNSGPFKWVMAKDGRSFSGYFTWQGKNCSWNGSR